MSRKKVKTPPTVLCLHGINAKFCTVCNKRNQKHLSPDQKLAFDTIMADPTGSFFLTGPAGSGKSFVVDHIRSTIPKVAVTATTGAAAQLIQGRTLHSFAGIHPTWGVINSPKADERIRKCDILIIDEISMADPKLLMQVFQRFSRAGKAPKIVLVGDFLQLPPVEGACLFEADFWPMFKVLRLRQAHRQKDDAFISALNDIRIGKMTDQVNALISSRRVSVLPQDCTQLVSRRDVAEQINVERLVTLPGQLYRSTWILDLKDEDKPPLDLSKSRFVEVLQLKNDARVVLLTNEPDGLWVNGSTGVVDSVSNGSVRVKLDNGKTVSVSKITDDVFDGDGRVVASITQYPIRLAFALTIHRSQGMSIDRIGVNLDNHFAAGQTYVALSRCKTSEGLYLCGNLQRLIVDARALKFCGEE